ncbi:MAG: hypothetical protein KDD53_07270 [Bdellovibrionales bacterium]|nr:hypothetical protein [Bdellovibrionales bacterium]
MGVNFSSESGVWTGSGFRIITPRQFNTADAALEIASDVASRFDLSEAHLLRVPSVCPEVGTSWEYCAMVKDADGIPYRVCLGLNGSPEALERLNANGSRTLFSLDLRETLGKYIPRSPMAPGSIRELEPSEVQAKIDNGETFVVNVETTWCSDCQIQNPNLGGFARTLDEAGISFFKFTVSREISPESARTPIYLSDEHERLMLELGGKGFPRTVLVLKGVIQKDSVVEQTHPLQLASFAKRVILRVGENFD